MSDDPRQTLYDEIVRGIETQEIAIDVQALRAARATGKPQPTSHVVAAPCNDPARGCECDAMTKYVRPDGTTYWVRAHLRGQPEIEIDEEVER